VLVSSWGEAVEAPASLLSELKRRRVFRALVAYGVGAFAVLQIIEPVMHGLHWPDAVLSYVVVILAVGFPVIVCLAWVFDLKDGRFERTSELSSHRTPRLAIVLVAIGVAAATPGLVYYFILPGHGRSAAKPVASIAVLPFAQRRR